MFSKNISGLIKKYVNKRIGYSLKNNIQNVVFYIISVKKSDVKYNFKSVKDQQIFLYYNG